MPRIRSQLAIQAPPELLERVRAAATARGQTVTRMLIDWIEAGLAGDLADPAGGSDLADRVSQLEAAMALLQARPARSTRTVEPVAPLRVPLGAGDLEIIGAGHLHPSSSEPPAPAGAITTTELAEQLGMKRGSLNERLRRAGGARAGLVMNGWRCVDQCRPPGGGPPQWRWEPA